MMSHYWKNKKIKVINFPYEDIENKEDYADYEDIEIKEEVNGVNINSQETNHKDKDVKEVSDLKEVPYFNKSDINENTSYEDSDVKKEFDFEDLFFINESDYKLTDINNAVYHESIDLKDEPYLENIDIKTDELDFMEFEIPKWSTLEAVMDENTLTADGSIIYKNGEASNYYECSENDFSSLGILKQREDGTTALNFLTGCEGNDPNQKEKPISLGRLSGKLTQGSSSLFNYRYRDNKRSIAKPVKPLYYGTFSSFCPSYDSTFASINKEESELVYATYGSETSVQCTESICDFSSDFDMAMHRVDQLLSLFTQQHSRTETNIEDRLRKQQEEQNIHSLLCSSYEEKPSFKPNPREISPNFSSLRTLQDLGIDTSFLSTFEKLEQKEKYVRSKLSENASLLATLSKEQKDRLSKPLPKRLNNLSGPTQTEVNLAAKVTEGLISIAREIPPGALTPVPIVSRSLGIT